MGARHPRADRRAPSPRETTATPRRSRTTRSAPSATRPSPPSAPRTWSTCAAPTSTPAGCSPRPTCRRSRRSAPGHIPTAANVPWSKAANDDGTFRSDDELKHALHRGRRRLGQGHHRLLPDRRALARTPGSCCKRAARPAERQELRRLVDRVRLAGRRPGRARRRAGRGLMCGATEGGLSLEGVDVAKESIIQGDVLRGRASRSATPTCGCSTGPASSPPRCRRRRPATSGSSRRRASGRCARWRPRPTPVDQTVVAPAGRRRRGRHRDLTHRARRLRCPSR